MKSAFGVYLHSHTCHTSIPREQIRFAGYSLPYWDSVRQALEHVLKDYPSLPLREAQLANYQGVHSGAYLDGLVKMAAGCAPEPPLEPGSGCLGLEFALPGYRFSLGGMQQAVDQMKRGVLERAYCFSLGGHHAFADGGHGYCLLNPLAAAARYAQSLGFKRILIVDWDLHHGDGTQAIFAHDPNVYCISIHSAADLYMATARGIRSGTTTAGKEAGHCNIPLLSQAYDDAFWHEMHLDGDFYRASDSLTVFAQSLEQIPWQPEMIMIFSGYDSHTNDQGREITDWTEPDFMKLTKLVLRLARSAHCPVLSVHGGGYNLPVTIQAAAAHVLTLANE
jgi:acetoin utilization deacetylase AcuC-like enzyme